MNDNTNPFKMGRKTYMITDKMRETVVQELVASARNGERPTSDISEEMRLRILLELKENMDKGQIPHWMSFDMLGEFTSMVASGTLDKLESDIWKKKEEDALKKGVEARSGKIVLNRVGEPRKQKPQKEEYRAPKEQVPMAIQKEAPKEIKMGPKTEELVEKKESQKEKAKAPETKSSDIEVENEMKAKADKWFKQSADQAFGKWEERGKMTFEEATAADDILKKEFWGNVAGVGLTTTGLVSGLVTTYYGYEKFKDIQSPSESKMEVVISLGLVVTGLAATVAGAALLGSCVDNLTSIARVRNDLKKSILEGIHEK